MKKYLWITIIAGFVMLTAPAAGAWQASEKEYREGLMDREMDCISRQTAAGGNIAWTDTCASQYDVPPSYEVARAREPDYYYGEEAVVTDTGSPAYEPVSSSLRYAQARSGTEMEDEYRGELDDFSMEDSSGWVDSSLTTFDVGVEGAPRYLYREPEFMRLKGAMYGVFGAVTFRTSENRHIKKIGDIFSEVSTLNMFRVDAKFSAGDLDYDSQSTGSDEGERNYMFETRGTAGYDIPVGESGRVTPYAGFGFRYLKDDSGGRLTSTGASGYDRESFYYYLPLGIETQSRLTKCWLLEAVLEYDYFIAGRQKSHFEDVHPGYNTLYNEQDSGYGMRGSIKIIREEEKFSIFVEPFVRYWNIEDSDIDVLTLYGVPDSLGIEPANKTIEYGVRAGLRF